MNIAEAARASGLSIDTIRYYERIGVLPRPIRRSNRYRDYDEGHLAALKLAHGLRELELPLEQVADIVRVAHDAACGEVRQALTANIEGSVARIEERMRKLRRTRERLRAILEGVRSMSPRSRKVPGMTPCACVGLVSEESTPISAVRPRRRSNGKETEGVLLRSDL
ncbi:MAG: MerR family transcriptional regulator [Dehalococcoidia bacterium]|nr:MerR family transcriptional regulator [Dehalococcoidia bacterium]